MSEERRPVREMWAARLGENVARDVGVLDVPRQVLMPLVALSDNLDTEKPRQSVLVFPRMDCQD